MYVETVPNRSSPPAILLRESWREDGKVHKRTLLNLSNWDPAHVEGLLAVLKGGTVIPQGQDAIRIRRILPHGHVAAALGTARRIGLDKMLGPAGNRCRDLVDAANTIKRHWDGILRWLDSRIANGLIEGINSIVQAAKAKARGYRSSRNLKAIVYLLAGKLDLKLPA